MVLSATSIGIERAVPEAYAPTAFERPALTADLVVTGLREPRVEAPIRRSPDLHVRSGIDDGRHRIRFHRGACRCSDR